MAPKRSKRSGERATAGSGKAERPNSARTNPGARGSQSGSGARDQEEKLVRLRNLLKTIEDTSIDSKSKSNVNSKDIRKKQQPPSFNGSTDPLEAYEWLSSIQAIFDHMQLLDGEKVYCASHMLKKIKKIRNDATMTWEEFLQVFNTKYYSKAIMAAQEDDFVRLIQGDSTVIEYASNFDRFAKFVEELIPTETIRVDRFIRGLKTMIVRDVKMTSAGVTTSFRKSPGSRIIRRSYLEGQCCKKGSQENK
ncbi:hypothetical protein POM88_036348 [Heracleum sosnowskyi]|uniref:Retrotransposon gag domain-containing protein n=1 Tax=Heracleum sosnowskyi TaxID=360622 RepID=A0AAD8HP47_9APIA|nr:hypothetical protein POM88_036348 [Heracleum sosnowskyi]